MRVRAFVCVYVCIQLYILVSGKMYMYSRVLYSRLYSSVQRHLSQNCMREWYSEPISNKQACDRYVVRLLI